MVAPLSVVLSRLRQPARVPLLQVGKTSLAVVVAWAVSSVVLHQSVPTFAAIAALLVMQPSVSQSFGRGLERSAGVVLGVAVAYVVGTVIGRSYSWIVLVAIVLALLVAWAFKLTPTSTTQVPISAMLVLAAGLVTPGYAFDRIVETVIGAVVALLVNAFVSPPVLVGPVHLALGRLARDIATALDDLALALTAPTDAKDLDAMLLRARALRPAQARAAAAVKTGDESLTLNPRASKQRRILEADRALLPALTNLVHRVVAMTRTVRDNYDTELVDDPVVLDIADQLRRAAHDARLLVPRTEDRAEESRGTAVTPAAAAAGRPGSPTELALTSPLRVLRPDPENWILIGSLLEDLRRVREEIVGDDPADPTTPMTA